MKACPVNCFLLPLPVLQTFHSMSIIQMKYLYAFLLLFTSVVVLAQDADEFLACAEISDRVARVICLEEALDEATRQEPADPSVEAAAVESLGDSSNTADSSSNADISRQDAEVPEVEEERGRFPMFRLPRLRNPFSRDDNEEEADSEAVVEIESESGQEEQLADFGRQTRIVVNENGEDELNDVVVDLDMVRPDQWLVTLASGQVWRQTHPRRLNLRKGDAVKIYPSGWGENFRLEAERLSGFIQILRVE